MTLCHVHIVNTISASISVQTDPSSVLLSHDSKYGKERKI